MTGRRTAQRDRAACNGMTLLEILCVMLLVSVFAALVFPGISALERSGKRRHAAATTASLVIAAEKYRTRYGRWPMLTEDGESDVFYAPDDDSCTITSGRLIEQASLMGAFTTSRIENPLQHRFIEADSENMKSGRLIDPWGKPYILLVDADGDHRIEIAFTHESAGELSLTTNATCIAFSWGDSPSHPVFSHSTN